MICTVCGENISKSVLKNRVLCQPCYIYIRNGNTVFAPSPYGSIHHDQESKPICHMCGQSHVKLGQHAYYHHHITTEEYKERFGLNQNTKLTQKEYSNKMRDYVRHYSNLVISDNLINKGHNTRFQTGQTPVIAHKKKSSHTMNNITQE